MNTTAYAGTPLNLAMTSQPGDEPTTPVRDKRIGDRRASGQLPLPSIHDLPLPAYSCNASGAVVEHNAAAAELWGRHPNPAQLFQWSGAMAIFTAAGEPLSRSSFPAAQAVASGRDIDLIDLSIARPDGSRREVTAHVKVLRSANAEVVGAVSMLQDRTEKEQLAGEIRRRDDGKDAFLAMLAHELRNPLAPILSAACLMREISADGRICGMASIVERQARQLARFVADLLDASNLAQEGIALRLDAVPLAGVMACALDELRPRADARKQRVAVEFEDEGSTVLCDPARTSQALANVMINASSFTADGGDIMVRARVDGDRLEVEVEDTGIGIAPTEIGELFKPYTQFATHAGRLRSGAGLGLAIAKDICERHGGLISASSPGRGYGSRFNISLPIVQ